MEEERTKLIGPFEMLMLLIVLGIIVYVGYPADGFSLLEKTEEIELLDKPRSSSTLTVRKKQSAQGSTRTMKQVLTSLAEDFADRATDLSATTTQDKWSELGLSTDEIKFYKKIKDTYNLDTQIQNTQDWLNVLQTAHATYSTVKTLFQEAKTGNFDLPSETQSKDHLRAKGAKPLVNQLQETFNLTEKQLRGFSQQGKSSISEWASFILENQ